MIVDHGIKHLYPGIRENQYSLCDRNDGKGVILEYFDESLGEKPTIAQLEAASLKYKAVPSHVTKRQFKLALFDKGYFNALENLLTTARRKLDFDESLEVRRVDRIVEQLREAVDISHEQMDDIFVIAGTL